MEPKTTWNGCGVYLLRGDITALDVDAIANAANSHLAGGGGVDGAIHRRGGPAVAAGCRAAMLARGGAPLEPGEGVVTPGGNLPARFVVHVVGPVYAHSDPAGAVRLLTKCYTTALGLVRQRGLKSVAFPCISTGVYGYPPADACPVALRAVRQDLEKHGGLDRVVFCTFLVEDFALYQAALTYS